MSAFTTSLPERHGTQATTLAYALRWRVHGWRPGAHAGVESGTMGLFRRVVPFDRSPDARRIDLRATIRDPFGTLQVRQFDQRTAAQIYVLVDQSGSMAFGNRSRQDKALALCRALAAAAEDIHDAFGIGAGAGALTLFVAARRRGVASALDSLAAQTPGGRQEEGLLEAAERLGRRRKLVFVLSDFEYSIALVERLLLALAAHDVVPVVMADRAREALPRRGLAELADMEDGRKRLVWLRPALHERWKREERVRARALREACLRHGRSPFIVDGELDLEAFSGYLLKGV